VLADPYVAMYALGRPGLGGSGNSRFTTSPNAATWAGGSVAPNGGCGPANLGSLYSTIPVTNNATLWVCEDNPTSPSWVEIVP
jgi:hypothetical protein